MSMIEVQQIPTRNDNYVYLFREASTGSAGVVDPSDAPPVLEALDRLGWSLTHIFTTHHHNDHVGGVPELVEKTGCTVVGPRADRDRIPNIAIEVGGGDTVDFHGAQAAVFDTPGHTRGHISYWFAESKALFCGDTLFSLGCGRLFEGTAEQMWTSLSKFKSIGDDTLVYCAHEYTQANARFAVTVDPENADLSEYCRQIDAARDADRPTVPSLMGLERRTNPFLRADQPGVAAAVGLPGKGPVEVFAEIRARKDKF